MGDEQREPVLHPHVRYSSGDNGGVRPHQCLDCSGSFEIFESIDIAPDAGRLHEVHIGGVLVRPAAWMDGGGADVTSLSWHQISLHRDQGGRLDIAQRELVKMDQTFTGGVEPTDFRSLLQCRTGTTTTGTRR